MPVAVLPPPKVIVLSMPVLAGVLITTKVLVPTPPTPVAVSVLEIRLAGVVFDAVVVTDVFGMMKFEVGEAEAVIGVITEVKFV